MQPTSSVVVLSASDLLTQVFSFLETDNANFQIYILTCKLWKYYSTNFSRIFTFSVSWANFHETLHLKPLKFIFDFQTRVLKLPICVDVLKNNQHLRSLILHSVPYGLDLSSLTQVRSMRIRLCEPVLSRWPPNLTSVQTFQCLQVCPSLEQLYWYLGSTWKEFREQVYYPNLQRLTISSSYGHSDNLSPHLLLQRLKLSDCLSLKSIGIPVDVTISFVNTLVEMCPNLETLSYNAGEELQILTDSMSNLKFLEIQYLSMIDTADLLRFPCLPNVEELHIPHIWLLRSDQIPILLEKFPVLAVFLPSSINVFMNLQPPFCKDVESKFPGRFKNQLRVLDVLNYSFL